jgi:hypothetical protein
MLLRWPFRGARPSLTRARRRAGFALEATLLVMVLIAVLLLAGAAAVISQQRTTTSDMRATQALYAAEGGTDALMSSISTLMADGQLTDAELSGIVMPTLPGWTFDTLEATKDGESTLQPITDGNFSGLMAWVQAVTVRVGAVDAGGNRGDVLVSTKAQSLPVFQFGVFYDEDIEVDPGPTMTVDGWVHSNQNIYLSATSLRFRSLLTAADSVFRNRKAANAPGTGVTIDNASGTAVLLNFDSRSTDLGGFESSSDATFDGRLRSDAYGTVPLRLPLPEGMVQSAIVAPRVGTDDAQARGVKMAWKADFVLRIDLATQWNIDEGSSSHFCRNFSAHVIRDSSSFNAIPNRSSCENIFHWNPTTDTDEIDPTRFRDRREARTVYALDIDIDALRTWIGSNASRQVKILYVEFYNTPANFYPAVRMINGSRLHGPLTVATHAPLYVVGNYNYTATPSQWQPAALMGDAITLLSNAWDDNGNRTDGCRYGTQVANCNLSPSNATSGTTRVYAAIAAGHSATTCDWARTGCSSPVYGGGFANFPRFLEDWSGRTMEIRGAFASFFRSQQAVGNWVQAVYSAPTRSWTHDSRYTVPATYPPGTPLVGTVLQLAYRPIY